MTCTDCAYSTPRYSPACLECGRRYLAAIKRQPIPAEEKVAWLRKVLADWMEFGHAESDLRAKPSEPESAPAAATASSQSARGRSRAGRAAR